MPYMNGDPPEEVTYDDFKAYLLDRWTRMEPELMAGLKDYEIEADVRERWEWCKREGLVIEKKVVE